MNWWCGFFVGMGTQYAVLLYLAERPVHRHWWGLAYWFGVALWFALGAAGWQVQVRRKKRLPHV